MSKLEVLATNLSRIAGRKGLILRKHSPEILVAVGIVGVIASTVMACKKTLKVDEILDDAQDKIGKIKHDKEECDATEGNDIGTVVYDSKDYKRDLAIVYAKTGVEFVKLYAPAVTLGIASVGCILGGHKILQKRNIALMAAYKAVEGSFRTYRNRVIDEFGEEKDRQYKRGAANIEVTEMAYTDEDGVKHKAKKSTVEVINPNEISGYAKFFDESCREWSKNPEYNLHFLKCQQNHANDLLKVQGHVFLNEIYDMLGIPRTQDGAVVGWVLGHGDDYVDFGIYDGNSSAKRDFVNGYERSILLDFNVDGVIWDMI